jgi:hypothetical protein
MGQGLASYKLSTSNVGRAQTAPLRSGCCEATILLHLCVLSTFCVDAYGTTLRRTFQEGVEAG